MNLIKEVVQLIAKGDEQKTLIEKYNDHSLEPNWKGYRELHILPDWLLIYYIDEDV